MKKLKYTLLISSGAALLLALVAVWHVGTVLSAPARAEVAALPDDLPGENVSFQSTSGATLRAWLIAGQKGKGAVVLMHGVRGSRLQMLDRARFLSRAGFTVLLFDFQAHGESTGEHVTTGYLESRDARSAVEFVRSRTAGEKIGVLGVSMGGAAALLARPPLDVDALVLEEVYPTIEQAVADRLTMRLGRWARTLTPLLTVQLKLRLGIDPRELRPIDHVGTVRAPKLIVAGELDQHTTLSESQQLFEAASGPKQFWIVRGARHQDLYAFAGREYEDRILTFFSEHLSGGKTPSLRPLTSVSWRA